MRIFTLILLLVSGAAIATDDITAGRMIQLESYLVFTGCEDHKTCQMELDKLPIEGNELHEKVARCQVMGGGKIAAGGCWHLVGDNF